MDIRNVHRKRIAAAPFRRGISLAIENRIAAAVGKQMETFTDRVLNVDSA
jgi:hypothetical protein